MLVSDGQLFFIDNGYVYHHGMNYYLSNENGLGKKIVSNDKFVKKIDGLENIVDITASSGLAYALDENGNIYSLNYDMNSKPLLLAKTNAEKIMLINKSNFLTKEVNILSCPRGVSLNLDGVIKFVNHDSICFMVMQDGIVKIHDLSNRTIVGSVLSNQLDTFRFIENITINDGYISVISHHKKLACYRIEANESVVQIIRIEQINSGGSCDDFNSCLYENISYFVCLDDGVVFINDDVLYQIRHSATKKICDANRIKNICNFADGIIYETYDSEIYMLRRGKHMKITKDSNLDSNFFVVTTVKKILF